MSESRAGGEGIKAELGSWRERYERLHKAFSASVGIIDSSSMYEHWAASLRDLTRADIVSIRILSATGTSLVRCITDIAPGAPVVTTSEFITTSTGRMPQLVKDKRPIDVDLHKPQPGDDFSFFVNSGYASALSIPIVHDEEVIGVFDAVYRESPWWNQDDVDYLCEVGRFIGAALRQDASRDSIVEFRVLEEGKRLSSEIHDNIAQLIIAIRLEAERAAMSLEEGDEDALASDIARIEATSSQASDLVRGELLALRSAVDGSDDFVDEVAGFCRRFEDTWHIETSLRLSGAESLSLSKNAELHMLRILNEALTNVYRHAQATKVVVGIECDGSFLFLRVSDNGIGFDREKGKPEGLGTKIMRERASQLGGKLIVESREAEGTKLCVAIPYLG